MRLSRPTRNSFVLVSSLVPCSVLRADVDVARGKLHVVKLKFHSREITIRDYIFRRNNSSSGSRKNFSAVGYLFVDATREKERERERAGMRKNCEMRNYMHISCSSPSGNGASCFHSPVRVAN